MPKFKVMIEGRGGWCEWIFPRVKKNYLMKCCDCGLVHEIQFRIVRRARGRLDVVFRARRNKRATAARRRKR